MNKFLLCACIGVFSAAGAALLDNDARAQSAPSADATATTYQAIRTATLRSDELKAFLGQLNWRSDQSGCPARLKPNKNMSIGGLIVSKNDGYIWQGDNLPGLPVRAKCTIDINTKCWSGVFPTRSANFWGFPSGRVAYAVFIRTVGLKYRVPPEITEPYAQAMERLALEQVASILNNLERRLFSAEWSPVDGRILNETVAKEREFATAWNKHRGSVSVAHDVPGMTYEPGCGFGGIDYTIKTSPEGGQVRLIPNFDWAICQSLAKDPWNADSCRGWTDVVTRIVNLSGSYRYEAKWTDGSVKRGVLTVNAPATVGDQVVTLSR